MTLDQTQRITEILLAFAFLQQSVEHIRSPERRVFLIRAVACICLVAGILPLVSLATLLATSLRAMHVFKGPGFG